MPQAGCQDGIDAASEFTQPVSQSVHPAERTPAAARRTAEANDRNRADRYLLRPGALPLRSHDRDLVPSRDERFGQSQEVRRAIAKVWPKPRRRDRQAKWHHDRRWFAAHDARWASMSCGSSAAR